MTPQEMVLEFHRAFNCSVDDRSQQTMNQRLNLIDEEYSEMLDEILDFDGDYGVNFGHTAPSEMIDWESVAKEMADLVYVIYGSAVAWGIDLDRALELVHKSNMSKVWEDGKPRYRESDGKVLKPPTYVKPNMTDTVKEI